MRWLLSKIKLSKFYLSIKIAFLNKDHIMIEESMPKVGSEEDAIFEAEVEIQLILPPMPSHHSPTFAKSLHHSSLHYDKLRNKRPSLPAIAPLRCEGHPFF